MRALLCLAASMVLIGVSGRAGEQPQQEQGRVWLLYGSSLSLADEPLPEGVHSERPESFDWWRYISIGSTFENMERAHQARAVLWKRLLVLEEREREERLRFGGEEHVRMFDEMQKQWRKLCSLECADYAGPSSEYKGSGWKARFPAFVVRQIQDRIEFLKREG